MVYLRQMRTKYIVKEFTVKMHTAKCAICQHPQRRDIELDYIHCIPWPEICRRYAGVHERTINCHARVYGLREKRNRKSWYWQFIEKYDFNKLTAESALEAAKQLDRLEHKLVERQLPSNIQVIYSSGLLKGENDGSGNRGGRGETVPGNDRLPALADAGEVPPEPEKVDV